MGNQPLTSRSAVQHYAGNKAPGVMRVGHVSVANAVLTSRDLSLT